MIPFTIDEICKACQGEFFGDPALLGFPVSDVVIDSRKATAGTLYVPVVGERFDGHDFIGAAREMGASCVVSQRPLESGPYILVSDALDALQDIARAYRRKFDIPIIGVTGSVGKTSTKEMLAAVLGTHFSVVKTVGSENNQTGVPLTIFRFTAEHEVAVVEMGTNHFGEIERLSRMAEPTVCLFTNIGVAHIEFFETRQGILKGKTEMLQHMRPGAKVIVNGDDDMLSTLTGTMQVGFGENCDLWGTDIEEHGLEGSTVSVAYQGKTVRVRVPAPGRHSVFNALMAIATGLTLGMSLEQGAAGVEAYVPPEGRMNRVETGRITLLDDAYNANPDSVMAAVDVMEKVTGRRVCILGDMMELGERSNEFHQQSGAYAAAHNIDLIICVGEMSEYTFLGASQISQGKTRYFPTQEAMLAALPGLIEDGDTVLVKASRSMHLEQTVDLLKNL